MRTTVTLDADVQTLLKEAAHKSGLPFKQVLNNAVRAGLAHRRTKLPTFKQPVYSLGRAKVDLTKAAALAGELEDQHALDKASGRKGSVRK